MSWRMLVAVFVVFCGALTGGASQAGELYKCKGENGETVFSDQPCPGAEALPMRETPTYSAPAKPTLPTGKEAVAKKKATNYQVEIAAPAVDAVIRDNEGKVNVEASINPRLDEDHRVRLLLDGSPVGTPGMATSWSLNDVERGEHTLVVEVVHKDSGKTFGTDQRKFMLFRASAADSSPNGANLSLIPGRNGTLVQQAQWPTMQDAAQPGDPESSTPTKPPGTGPRK